MEEILNLDYHRREMTLKALNRSHTKIEAYRLLGIPERTFYNYLDRFKIFYDDKKMKYESRQKTDIVTISLVYTTHGRKVAKHL